MTDGFYNTPKLVHEHSPDAALAVPVLASLLIEVHAGLIADPRLSHLASDIETVIYEVVAAARLRKGEAGKKAFPALRLVRDGNGSQARVSELFTQIGRVGSPMI